MRLDVHSANLNPFRRNLALSRALREHLRGDSRSRERSPHALGQEFGEQEIERRGLGVIELTILRELRCDKRHLEGIWL